MDSKQGMPSNTKKGATTFTGPAEEPRPDHACLIPLRIAARSERQAIAFYLEASLIECRLAEVFLDIAKEEMQHFVEIMRMISSLDPVQAKALEEMGLKHLVAGRALVPKWAMEHQGGPEVIPPHLRDMQAISLLTRAISDELEAVNQYQTAMMQSKSIICRELFCELMNDEKEHVAKFTSVLFEFTHEPPKMC
jgi:rubrerythrin